MSDIYTYAHADWLAEARRRFGDNALDWRFVCPFCGNVASGRDWKDAGGDPQRSYVECIGRLIGAKGGLNRDREQPCDWAAFGLLGTLHGGARVKHQSGEMLVFDFAPQEEGPP